VLPVVGAVPCSDSIRLAQAWDDAPRKEKAMPQSTSPRREVGPASGLQPKGSC